MQNKLKLFFYNLILFGTVLVNAQAQNKTIDSLKILLKNPKIQDTTRLFIIANLIDQYHQKEAYIYWNNAMGKLATTGLKRKNGAELNKKYTMYLGSYYNNLGVIYDRQGHVTKTFESFDKSIALFRSVKVYNEMNYALIAKGVSLCRIYEYEKAISCYFEALNYFEKYNSKNFDGISYAYSSIGAAYSELKEYEKSVRYFKEGMLYFEKNPDKNLPENNTVLCEFNVNCGSSLFLMKKYPEAILYFERALSLAKSIHDNSTSSIILSKIARIKIEEGKYEEAESTLRNALITSNSALTASNVNLRFGELYAKKKELQQADVYLTKALYLARQANSLTLQEDASELLYKVNQEHRNFEKALDMHLLFDKFQDSIKINQSRNTFERQELQHSFEKKAFNYQLATQKKNDLKNNFLIGFSSVILLLLVGGYFYYRTTKQKQAISAFEKNEIKQKLLITQMNPHFIFNSIDNIQSLIYNKQDQEAVNYLTKFSKLTRQILENSNENYISLAEELTMIDNYLVIQQLLYNNTFDFTITVEDEIDAEAILLPPMLTQPFIENAIKHGIQNKTQRGSIAIKFSLKDSKLYFEVKDNGSGFGTAPKDGNHKSLAMTITKERLINYTKKQDFTVQTENVLDQNEKIVGAKVIFEIPYIYEN